MGFLDSLNKTVVGIAVTQNVGLEVGIIDKKTSQVIKYASRPLEYNIASREIDNYGVFKSTLEEIYSDLNIDQKSNVYVVLPNVHFDFTNLPLATMNNDAVAEHILNKIEESNYIFRRFDPMTSWDDVNFRDRTDSRYVVHSSIQAPACEKIRDIIQEFGGNLIGIEGAYTAILRGIEFSGLVKDYIDNNEMWSTLLINSNSYIMFQMKGDKLIDCSEFPLALRSFSPEEVYQAIANPVSQFMSTQSAKKLLIVSQSDEVSAEILKNSLSFDGEIIPLNSNKFADAPIVFGAPSNQMTLSLIGACVSGFSKFPLKLNVLSPKEGGGTGSVETSKINTISIVVIFIALLLGFAAYFGVGAYNSQLEAKNSELQSQIQQTQAQIDALSADTKVNINQILNEITEHNLKTMAFFNSLSVDIPKSVWLSHFASKNGEQVFVEGMSTNIRDIYRYYKSLKLLVPSSSVTLSKLKMVSNLFDTDYSLDNMKDDMKLYSFAIGNDIAATAEQPADGSNPQQNNGSQGSGTQPTSTKINQNGSGVDSVPPDVNLQPINDDMFE